MTMAAWFIRKWFWGVLAWFKAAVNKPMVIPMPPAPGVCGTITPVPLSQAIPGLPINAILVCPPEQIPADERSLSKTLFYRLQVWLYGVYSPMQPGLPSIDRDPDKALRGAFSWLLRTKLAPPVLPAEYLGKPDLGALAVRGPYACYTRRCADGGFEWDLQSLANFEHHPGLRRLGVRVLFEVDRTQRSLRATRIDSELGTAHFGDERWELASRLALCSVTTHLALVRHFNWLHLAGAAHSAIATRNQLPSNHPLMRLLWPYIYATAQSNHTVTRGQMLPGGDFEAIFSYSFAGMCALFDESHRAHDFGINDPAQDAQARQVLGQGFDTPTEHNLIALFDVMHAHARHYLALYYPHAAQGAGTEGLHSDRAVLAWLDELNRLVPNGVGMTSADLNLDGLARLAARIIYLVSAQHEIAGGFLWNYQVWTHRHPVRVYAGGQPEPLDVYQRLVEANFNLNVRRRALIDDFSSLALDPQGAAAMQRFCHQLEALQCTMDQSPWTAWTLYPRALKVNLNA
jgi:hypothetical protein